MPADSDLRGAPIALALLVSLSCTACNVQELTSTLFQDELRSSASPEVADANPVHVEAAPSLILDATPPPVAPVPAQTNIALADDHDSDTVDYMSGEQHGGPGETGVNNWYGGSYEGEEGQHDSDEAEYMQSSGRGGPDGEPESRQESHDADEEAYMTAQDRWGPDGPQNGERDNDGDHSNSAAAYMSSGQRDGPSANMGGATGAQYPSVPTMNSQRQPARPPTAPQGHALVKLQRGIALAQTTTAGTLMSFNIEYEAAGVSNDPNTRYLLLIQPPRGRAQTMIVQLKPEGFLFATNREWKDLRGEFKAQIVEERRGQGVRAVSQVLKLPAG